MPRVIKKHSDSLIKPLITTTSVPVTTESYSITGKVVSNGQPVANAAISIDGNSDIRTSSTESGDFTLENVPTGEQTIHIEKEYNDIGIL